MIASVVLFTFAALVDAQYCLAKNSGRECDTFGGTWPCCGDILRDIPEFEKFQSRRGLDDDLITQLAHGHPVLSGTSTIATLPPNMGFHARWTDSDADIKMAVKLYVLHIFDINQKSQSFKMHYVLASYYRDCRLMQNCSAYLVVDSTHPEFHSFWKPKFLIEELLDDEASMRTEELGMNPDGLTVYTDVRLSTFRCKFDFEKYPFDTQRCSFTVLSPSLMVHHIELGWDTTLGGAIKVKEITNPGWFISKQEEWTLERGYSNNDFYVQESGGSPSYIVAYVTFQRSWRREFLDYVLPTVAFWFASWVGLLIDNHAVPARAAMAIIPILILTNKMNTLSAALPPMRNTNRIELYMLCMLGLLSFHLLEFALVNFAMRRDRELKAAAAAIKDAEREDTPAQVEDDDVQVRSAVIVSIKSAASKVSGRTDNFAIRYLNQNLNIHTRWISLLVFLATSIILFAV